MRALTGAFPISTETEHDDTLERPLRLKFFFVDLQCRRSALVLCGTELYERGTGSLKKGRSLQKNLTGERTAASTEGKWLHT
jgi:hypothetical protein